MKSRRLISDMVFPARAAGFPDPQPSTEGPAGPPVTLEGLPPPLGHGTRRDTIVFLRLNLRLLLEPQPPDLHHVG
jgi:hypothetical protein